MKNWRSSFLGLSGTAMLGVVAIALACSSDETKNDDSSAASTSSADTTASNASPTNTGATDDVSGSNDDSNGDGTSPPTSGDPTADDSSSSDDATSSPTSPSTSGDGDGGGSNDPSPDLGGGGSGSTPDVGDGMGGAGGALGAGGGSGTGGGSGAGGAAPGAGGADGMDSPAPLGTPMVVVGGFDYASDTYPLTIYDIDVESGALSERGSIDAGPNPSYLALAPTASVLYVANEVDSPLGGLTALSIADDGTLSVLNHQSGSDGGFTYVAVDPTGSFALGASYNGGSISVFPIESDGSLGPETATRDFGDMAQSHAVGFDPSGAYVLVPNKGNDEVAQLLLGSDGSLSDNTPASVSAAGGSGPRHIAVHPNGQLAFVMNELDSTMTPYQLSETGTLTAGTTVSTRAGGGGQNSGAHVELSPDGGFVYGSNRGDDDIVVFSADQTTGELSLLEHESTRGRTPRDFEVDPAGRVLIAANQDSGDLSVYAIAEDGSLDPLGQPSSGPPSPAAVQMIYLP